MGCLRSFVWFPILFVVLMGGGFFATYAWSVSLDHVYQLPLWPFVSDTGAHPPESCLFTLLLTWAAFVVFIVMFTYYRFVIQSGHGSRLNTAALVIGVISCFGITMVGSFQYTNLLEPHLIGAFMAFIGAVIYSWMVVYMNFRHMTPSVHGPGIARFRAAIAILDSISLVVLIIASILKFVGSAVAYNLLTISEWLLIYFAIIFVATFVFEFRLIRGFQVTLVMKSDATTSPSDRTTTPFETMKMSPAAQRNSMANSHAF